MFETFVQQIFIPNLIPNLLSDLVTKEFRISFELNSNLCLSLNLDSDNFYHPPTKGR